MINGLFPIQAETALFSAELTIDDFKRVVAPGSEPQDVGLGSYDREKLAEALLEMADDMNDNLAEYRYMATVISDTWLLVFGWTKSDEEMREVINDLFPIKAEASLVSLTLDLADFKRFLPDRANKCSMC